MKSEYKKPSLVIESFTLCEHIAENCGLEGGWSTHWESGGANPCGIRTQSVTDDTLVLFVAKPVCNVTEADLPDMGLTMEDLEVYQYHNGSITHFFSS